MDFQGIFVNVKKVKINKWRPQKARVNMFKRTVKSILLGKESIRELFEKIKNTKSNKSRIYPRTSYVPTSFKAIIKIARMFKSIKNLIKRKAKDHDNLIHQRRIDKSILRLLLKINQYNLL